MERLSEGSRHRAKNVALARHAEWWAKGCPGADIDLDTHLAALRDEGWDATALRIEHDEIMDVIEDGLVEPDHWQYVCVFSHCSWTHRPAGMGASEPAGIAGTEILAVCQLLRVPAKQWPDMLHAVKRMAATALPILLERSRGK